MVFCYNNPTRLRKKSIEWILTFSGGLKNRLQVVISGTSSKIVPKRFLTLSQPENCHLYYNTGQFCVQEIVLRKFSLLSAVEPYRAALN
jgi:hypothetical protein